MSTIRKPSLRRLAAVVALATLALFVAQAAAAKTYKDKDLKGVYQFIVSEVRIQGPEVEYCTQYGSADFDGRGAAEIVTAVRRCTLYPSVTVQVDMDEVDAFHYEVFSNGELLLIELDEMGLETDYVTHGRILQKGKLLLFDGTASFPHHPDFLLTTAVAAKE